ncbi:hypothetical protein CCUS01_04305 [Colletotrichum cuscutae]|uniref:Uncharacterized protein n=1 Tax=Colletotrichum cuscutae TaxID=1209917 RepID=A0AAI9Y5A3_9PEZI|nr:hypothetical protein CCUS01_04305 [Colletotrichum cuscutae]
MYFVVVVVGLSTDNLQPNTHGARRPMRVGASPVRLPQTGLGGQVGEGVRRGDPMRSWLISDLGVGWPPGKWITAGSDDVPWGIGWCRFVSRWPSACVVGRSGSGRNRMGLPYQKVQAVSVPDAKKVGKRKPSQRSNALDGGVSKLLIPVLVSPYAAMFLGLTGRSRCSQKRMKKRRNPEGEGNKEGYGRSQTKYSSNREVLRVGKVIKSKIPIQIKNLYFYWSDFGGQGQARQDLAVEHRKQRGPIERKHHTQPSSHHPWGRKHARIPERAWEEGGGRYSRNCENARTRVRYGAGKALPRPSSNERVMGWGNTPLYPYSVPKVLGKKIRGYLSRYGVEVGARVPHYLPIPSSTTYQNLCLFFLSTTAKQLPEATLLSVLSRQAGIDDMTGTSGAVLEQFSKRGAALDGQVFKTWKAQTYPYNFSLSVKPSTVGWLYYVRAWSRLARGFAYTVALTYCETPPTFFPPQTSFFFLAQCCGFRKFFLIFGNFITLSSLTWKAPTPQSLTAETYATKPCVKDIKSGHDRDDMGTIPYKLLTAFGASCIGR